MAPKSAKPLERIAVFMDTFDLVHTSCLTMNLTCAAIVPYLSDYHAQTALTSMVQSVLTYRKLLLRNPSLLACPTENLQQILVIVNNETLKSTAWQSELAGMSLQVMCQMEVTWEQLECCLEHTLMVRLAPQWNRVGSLLVQGMDFLNCSADKRINAVHVEVHCRKDKWFLSVESTQVKLSCLKLTDVGMSAAQSEQCMRNEGDDFLRHAWVHVLPSMKKGQLLGVHKQLYQTTAMKTHEHLQTYWREMYGYELPNFDQSSFYCNIYFRLLGPPGRTYPNCCVFLNDVEHCGVVYGSHEIVGEFLICVAKVLENVCDHQLKLLVSSNNAAQSTFMPSSKLANNTAHAFVKVMEPLSPHNLMDYDHGVLVAKPSDDKRIITEKCMDVKQLEHEGDNNDVLLGPVNQPVHTLQEPEPRPDPNRSLASPAATPGDLNLPAKTEVITPLRTFNENPSRLTPEIDARLFEACAKHVVSSTTVRRRPRQPVVSQPSDLNTIATPNQCVSGSHEGIELTAGCSQYFGLLRDATSPHFDGNAPAYSSDVSSSADSAYNTQDEQISVLEVACGLEAEPPLTPRVALWHTQMHTWNDSDCNSASQESQPSLYKLSTSSRAYNPSGMVQSQRVTKRRYGQSAAVVKDRRVLDAATGNAYQALLSQFAYVSKKDRREDLAGKSTPGAMEAAKALPSLARVVSSPVVSDCNGLAMEGAIETKRTRFEAP